ncbi:MAG: cyclophilin-like fold protein [Lachnospiraceae bacterium]|nr:cyclophilin-like fold protein [Lachnospiraceae bacterium]
MLITIGDTVLTATLENNEAADALKKLLRDRDLTINFSQYGGFEQVGSIGSQLPTDDVQTTTTAGDIMLYSGNQMVMFYGNHSWAYTRLGKMDPASAGELENILGNGDITATFSLAEADLEVNAETVKVNSEMLELEDGLSAISFKGNDGFLEFMEQGGASSDAEVVEYLKDKLLSNIPDLIFGGEINDVENKERN